MTTKLKNAAGFAALLSIAAANGAAAQDETLLLRDPTLSEREVAFVYAGDIWIADRSGADPRRLTSHPADETNPVFSPDGSMIAFTAGYDNNQDVYVISREGGQPTRLTWHPGPDVALDWSPDGSSVAFASPRETNHGRSAQLYHVKLTGGLPEKQMEARIFRGRYDAAGRRFAYLAYGPAYNGLYGGTSGWRGYRGGTTPSILILDKAAGAVEEIPGDRVNDLEPMWVGDDIYFLSDREDKTIALFRRDGASGAIEKVAGEAPWDIRAADAHGASIVYEAGGRLKLFDAASGATSEIRIRINPDLVQLRPQWKDASKQIEAFDLSPSGKRVAVTARGEVFSVPVEDGSTRNLTGTDGAREYTALWSPDGKRVAYIDAAEEMQRLVIEDQSGLSAPRRFDLGAAFHTLLDWGGTGERIVYSNQKLELFAIETSSGRIVKISTGARRDQVDVDTSPDGRWLAYTEEQPNFNRQLKLFEYASGRSYPVGDALADASSPAFSRDGKYLFFAASTNSGPSQVFLDMSTQEVPYRAGLYVAVLASGAPSPLKPKTGDEGEAPAPAKKDEGAAKAPSATRIDVEGLAQRIDALPLAERNYSHLAVAKSGALYFIRNVQPGASVVPPRENAADENALMRFDFEKREAKEVMKGVDAARISAGGEHIIVRAPDGTLKVGEIKDQIDAKPLKLADVKLLVDPRKEWTQIFDEAWRMEKHYFYDPNMHGLDWRGVYDRYRPLVAHVGRREDLTALIVEMIGEMQAGHNRSGGGDIWREQGPGVGLLGADFRLENGRTRIARIYSGESWNPFLKGPLAAPGLNIRAGDYILAVNGRNLGAGDNIFAMLQGAAGKQTTLRVASGASGEGARDVVVEPVDQENQLRLWAWVEGNRRAVERATDGRIGYVYLPNTAGAGFTLFNRMFFAQVDKDAMIIDERSNGGGQAANYITDVLSRFYLAGWKDFAGRVFNTPGGAMYGAKVMLIDQDAGSGGDFLPYSFRAQGIGPLIGTRTWGGLIGISANPPLIDGGALTVPYFRFFDRDYRWTVENEGVAPDIEVALDPVATNAGRDVQLERAIAEARRLLAERPSPVPTTAPPYPTRLGE